jgi:hypothetical protein
MANLMQVFVLDVRTDLKNKLFVDFMLFYCNRGRENLRELKKTDFSFHESGDNKYIALRRVGWKFLQCTEYSFISKYMKYEWPFLG